MVASANKCLEGVPGMGFAVIRQTALEAAKGHCGSLSLDLHDQWVAMEKTGQWRFTPPTHVIAALDQALAEHAAEGGVEGAGARYARNCGILVSGLRAMGFETLLPDAAPGAHHRDGPYADRSRVSPSRPSTIGSPSADT